MSGTVLRIMVSCGRFWGWGFFVVVVVFFYYFYFYTNQQPSISIYIGGLEDRQKSFTGFSIKG